MAEKDARLNRNGPRRGIRQPSLLVEGRAPGCLAQNFHGQLLALVVHRALDLGAEVAALPFHAAKTADNEKIDPLRYASGNQAAALADLGIAAGRFSRCR